MLCELGKLSSITCSVGHRGRAGWTAAAAAAGVGPRGSSARDVRCGSTGSQGRSAPGASVLVLGIAVFLLGIFWVLPPPVAGHRSPLPLADEGFFDFMISREIIRVSAFPLDGHVLGFGGLVLTI